MLWHVGATLLILAAPAQWYLGSALPLLSPPEQLQLWAWAAAYLVLALSLVVVNGRDAAPRWSLPFRVAVCFGVAWLALRFSSDVPVSRAVLLLALGLATILSMGPAFIGKRGLLVLTALLFGLAGVSLAGGNEVSRAPTANRPARVLATEREAVASREYRGLVDSVQVDGGALAAFGDGFLLVTGEGEFYRVGWGGPDSVLVSRRLPLTATFNRDKLFEAGAEVFGPVGGEFEVRTTDIAIDTTVSPQRVYLAHNYWNPEQRCQTVRVSVADLPDSAATPRGDAWTLLYETSPCVAPSYELRRAGVGARLAWLDTKTLALSVGDHGLGIQDGHEGPQDPASPYGKILRLGTDGRVSMLSRGHRNPQGLAVTRGGALWSTEHGPQGGDEVNAVVAGANYGWPLATYGVQYGQDRWPLMGDRRDHTGFAEPSMAFVPSIGISNLIEVEGGGFPEWQGDLLVSSLRDRSLYRMRTHGDRIIFTERVPVGYRVRDLEQARNGHIVLWLDGGVLMDLSRAPMELEGPKLYATCAGCHGTALEGTPTGPSLRGVVGREIASTAFGYTPALDTLKGEWTAERLDVFLQDPAKFAPGTRMVLSGLDQRTRFRIIEYLRDYRP